MCQFARHMLSAFFISGSMTASRRLLRRVVWEKQRQRR